MIVAELSANHNNDFDLAVETIKKIAETGADAVKVQTYRPESLTLELDTGLFSPRKEGLWKGYTPWELYSKASMPYEWQPKLKKIAEDMGLFFFSSVFDQDSVDFLNSIHCPIYKIASFEITDIPLIRYAASKGKPIIISTGVAEIDDIQAAVDACKEEGNQDITLLKCTSEYPATVEKANLATITDMRIRFGTKVGVSDHTMSSIVAVTAVALGATLVEKHFILDRRIKSPDSAFSMEPNEFEQLVHAVRQTETVLGRETYIVSEKDKLRRRSLFITNDIQKGEILTKYNIRSIRPGHGLHPKHFSEIIGRRASRNLKKGEPLGWSMLEKG